MFYNCNPNSYLWVLGTSFASCYVIKFKEVNGKINGWLIKCMSLVISFRAEVGTLNLQHLWMDFLKLNLDMAPVRVMCQNSIYIPKSNSIYIPSLSKAKPQSTQSTVADSKSCCTWHFLPPLVKSSFLGWSIFELNHLNMRYVRSDSIGFIKVNCLSKYACSIWFWRIIG